MAEVVEGGGLSLLSSPIIAFTLVVVLVLCDFVLLFAWWWLWWSLHLLLFLMPHAPFPSAVGTC